MDRATASTVIEDKLLQLGLHQVCSWSTLNLKREDQKLEFICHAHDEVCSVSSIGRYLAGRNPESLRTPGCKRCKSEQCAENAAGIHFTEGGDRYDTLEKHLYVPGRSDLPCYFYIASISTKILKPGIASDPKKRAYTAKHQGCPYKEFLFVSAQMPRAEAWVIEQYVLLKTVSSYPTKDQLPRVIASKSWAGSSELRVSTLDHLHTLFEEGVSKLHELDHDWARFHSIYI